MLFKNRKHLLLVGNGATLQNTTSNLIDLTFRMSDISFNDHYLGHRAHIQHIQNTKAGLGSLHIMINQIHVLPMRLDNQLLPLSLFRTIL